MKYRDTLLFATTGWDPTWERRLSPTARAVWAVAVSVLSAIFGAAALLAWWHGPPALRWMPIALAGGWLVAVGVVQVLVRREVMRRLDVEADQIAARSIQVRLLPSALPTSATFELAAHYAPFQQIGGDYYDVSPIGEARWLVAMADVSGKGTGAALLTASVQALVHFAHANEPSLEAAVAAINRHLVHYAPPERFATMLLGILDLQQRRLRYVNAGHNPPLAVTADGVDLRLSATGPPLGMFEAASYTTAEVDLPAGTTCVFYTDGLVERADQSGAFFGEEGATRVLHAQAGSQAAAVLAALVAENDRFARGNKPDDDIALLVVRSR